MSLLVVGALHWDVVVRAPRLPQLDETLRGSDVAYQFGGKGGNQAIAAARAGADVAFAGRIGADDAGSAMQALLVAQKVDVTQLQKGDGASGMSAAIVTSDGNYGAVIVSAENHQFLPDQLTIPDGCQAVLLQNEMKPDVLSAVATTARRQGAKVIWNAAPALDVAAGDLTLIDTLIVNRVEAAQILGIEEIQSEAATTVKALAKMVPNAQIIITLGEAGVAFADVGGAVQEQAAQRVTVHSTHGAGDVFVGTFVAKQMAGKEMADAIAAGQAAAANHIAC